MKKFILLILLTVFMSLWLSDADFSSVRRVAMAASQTASKTAERGAVRAVSPSRPETDEAAALETKRQQLMEKEAALKVKEEELNKMSASLENRINGLNAARKAMDASVQAKKKEEGERFKKMLKIYKSLRPEAAGKLLDKLDEPLVIKMLDQMDQKTVVKLIPYLNQPRVLEWTKENIVAR